MIAPTFTPLRPGEYRREGRARVGDASSCRNGRGSTYHDDERRQANVAM
jgi:hypothetical protein